jgi:hypothetical protein
MRCPNFSGEGEEYEDWKNKVEDWLIVEEKIKYPGLEIRMALKDEAFELCKDVDREELKEKGSEKKIFDILDVVYKKDSRVDKMEKALNLFGIEKKTEETMKEYVRRYEKCSRECSKAGGGKMDEELKGSHLLRQAKMSKTEVHLVLGACGKEKYEYEVVKSVLSRIFQESDKLIKKEEKTWVVEERGKQGKDNKCFECGKEGHWARNCWDRNSSKKEKECYICKSKEHMARECSKSTKNVREKEGVARRTDSECYICRAKDHWAYKCPENWRNLKGKEENVGKENDRKKVYDNKETRGKEREEERHEVFNVWSSRNS